MRVDDLIGVVLAGGRAVRMGIDKSQIVYHHKAHKYHIADLITSLGIPSLISQNITQDQNEEYQFVIDSIDNIGPIGGIISVFEKHPQSLLVLACDYPEVSTKNLEQLLGERDPNKSGTFLFDSNDGLIPTFGIYEKELLTHMINMKNKGFYSLKECIKDNDIHKVVLEDGPLKHINSSAEYREYINPKNED